MRVHTRSYWSIYWYWTYLSTALYLLYLPFSLPPTSLSCLVSSPLSSITFNIQYIYKYLFPAISFHSHSHSHSKYIFYPANFHLSLSLSFFLFRCFARWLIIVLINKLLTACSSINTIYLLVRSKKGKDVDSRIAEIFEDPVSIHINTHYNLMMINQAKVLYFCIQYELAFNLKFDTLHNCIMSIHRYCVFSLTFFSWSMQTMIAHYVVFWCYILRTTYFHTKKTVFIL